MWGKEVLVGNDMGGRKKKTKGKMLYRVKEDCLDTCISKGENGLGSYSYYLRSCAHQGGRMTGSTSREWMPACVATRLSWREGKRETRGYSRTGVRGAGGRG